MTKETKHTPAPWKVDHDYLGGGDGYRAVIFGNNEIVQFMSAEDANLIATAPELLEALEYMVAVFNDGSNHYQDKIIKAENAIAKAKGLDNA